MTEFLIYYLIACVLIFIWMVCDLKYYEIRDTLKYYHTMNKHIEEINDKIKNADKDDIEQINHLLDEKTYWENLNKDKEKVKYLLHLKKYM